MAKSLRSKWRRKCRAIKRVRYGQKELIRLKKMLENSDELKSKVNNDNYTNDQLQSDCNDMKMEVIDEQKQKRIYDPITMRDQFGNYPVWMNRKKIRTLKRLNQKKQVKRNVKKKM